MRDGDTGLCARERASIVRKLYCRQCRGTGSPAFPTDNDCDGRIDEELRKACGLCGALPRDAYNIDDDCDGEVDSGIMSRRNRVHECRGPCQDNEDYDESAVTIRATCVRCCEP